MTIRSFAVLLLLPFAAVAQDMPLFTFTKLGDGWAKADGKKPANDRAEIKQGNATWREYPKVLGSRYTLALRRQTSIIKSLPSNKFEEQRHWPRDESDPLSLVATLDGGTVYVGFSSESAVWAFTPDKDGTLTNGAPYAPLRIRKGYDNDKQARENLRLNPPTLAVTALALDPVGRLFATTGEEVQVFDPTGRACGSLPLPAKGTVEAMVWEKDALAVWVGGQKWTRGMKP